MKKLISIILMAIIILSSVSAVANSPIKIFIDGKEIASDVAPVIINDRTMVPLRVIFEALGADITWSDALKQAYATLGETTVMLTIGSNIMYTNDDTITLDSQPYIQDGRTMIPIRAVCEVFGCTVSWHEPSKSVIIRTQSYEGPSIPASLAQPGFATRPLIGNQYHEVIVNNDAYYVKDSSALIDSTISIINNHRTQAGLKPLEYNETLEGIAYSHSKDMADNNYIAHTSPSGVTFNQRIDSTGIAYSSAAENIASGFISAEKVVESWMNSELHKNNILNPDFNKVGLGYYAGGSNGTYWTLLIIAG